MCNCICFSKFNSRPVQTFFDAEIKKMNIKNAYFPLFLTKNVLEKEKDHIEGFVPEVSYSFELKLLSLHLFFVDRDKTFLSTYFYICPCIMLKNI